MKQSGSLDCAETVTHLFERHNVHPVLFDIGASGPPRIAWNLVAPHSIFVGFDPDLRELRELTGTAFHRAVKVNEAVTSERNRDTITFFLTRSPYCSSTLEPDMEHQSNYSLFDLFQVEGKVEVKATTLEAVLMRLGLDRVDWFKVDSQGTDSRLFNSLPHSVRDRVFCVEIEPGLVAGYKGEDVFIDAHRDLLNQGFWLADASMCGAVRIRQSSIQRLRERQPGLVADDIGGRCRVAPGWVEATYLRSVDQLIRRGASSTDFVLLWAFAVAIGQLGFALDVALAYERNLGTDETSEAMTAPLIRWFTRAAPAPPQGAIGVLKSHLPVGVKRWLKRQLISGSE
jgi:FkbM family methyltransferase